MVYLKKLLSFFFIALMGLTLWHCAKRGNPTGGEKDTVPPKLTKAEPDNYSINFTANKIRLYFDELVKLEDAQNQLIVSPPFKHAPEIKPLSTASKYIEVVIKDTLQENTTYTLNFGQSIVDNNEGNPNSFFSYVFSTGTYIDSLTVSGAVKDAFNRKADEYVNVLLYELDSAYTDSTIYKSPPNYLTSTSDSLPLFELKNLKAGNYAMFALKDVNKNNLFDQRQDKIGFLQDTISIPTDSIYLLNLFREQPDYSVSVPSYAAKNRILFGYQGDGNDIKIETLTQLPDSVKTVILKEREKDTLNYWLKPTDLDSIIFTVSNEKLQRTDTFTVKSRKLPLDSMRLSASVTGKMNFEDTFGVLSNTPLVSVDTTRIGLVVNDSLLAPFNYALDTIGNKIDFDFTIEPNQKYRFSFLPGAVTDFFGVQNDTLNYNLSTGSYADYGNLRFNITGNIRFPMIVQLTNEKGEVKRELMAERPMVYEFNGLEPSKYRVRVIFDDNGNGVWDTGNYLKKIQPEKVVYFPEIIDMRANWERNYEFSLPKY
ncbi:MAG: Ig-like domain-containing protein [Flavobacteriaceae bacterium]